MNLHEHLKAHHTVRLSDGVEVEKPEHKDQNWAFALQQYEDAIEVIKMPDLIAFWNMFNEIVEDGGIVFFEESHSIMNAYVMIMQEPPTLSEFVAVGKNGEVLQGYYKDGNLHYDGVSVEELQTAQDNVIYEGWKLGLNGENLIVIYNGMEKIYFYKNGVISFNGEDITTTDDLNRKTQLYMKIK